MKNKFTSISVLCLMILSLIGFNSFAQVSSYTTAVTTPGPFTPITAPFTELGGDANDEFYWSGDPINPVFENPGSGSFIVSNLTGFPIGFNFNLGGNWYDRFSVCDNGYIQLHTSVNAGTSLSQGISSFTTTGPWNTTSTAARNTIGVLCRDISANPNPGTSSLRYKLSGTAPNRRLTVQWLNYQNFGGVSQDFDFQIILFETSNQIQLVYNDLANVATGNIAASAGIRGFKNLIAPDFDFRKLTNVVPTNTMNAPTVAPQTCAGGCGNTITFRNGFNPTNGLTYTFSPSGVVCNSPSNIVSTVVGNQVNTSWAAVGGATNYELEFRTLPAGTFAPAAGSPVAGTSLNVTGLSPSTSYEFRLRTNCGSFSDWVTWQRTIPGPGENCALAIAYGAVAPNLGACTPTVVNSGLANDGGNVFCVAAPTSTDVYYSFVAPSNGNKLILETFQNGGNSPDWTMEVFTACGGSLVACNDDRSGVDFRPLIELCQGDYVGGQTYIVRLGKWSSVAGPIDLCIYEDTPCPPAPANNLCSSPTTINVETYGNCPSNAVQFTTTGATPDPYTNPTCDPFGVINDVWVTFNSGLNSSLILTYSLAGATDVKAAVYATCGGAQLAGSCFTLPGTYALNGLAPSTNYLIRFWSNNAGAAGTFNVCLSETPNCPGGLGSLTVIPSIPYTSPSLTTCGSGNTIQSGMLNQVCGSNNYLGGEDRTFQFQVPTNGSYQILLTTNSTWSGMKLFADCPLAGRGGTCVASIGTSAANKSLNNLILTAGVDYYLILDQFPPPSCIGEFILTIQPTPPPPSNDNCGLGSATLLTQQTTCSYFSDNYSGSATASPEAVCPGGVVNDDDVWYRFVAVTSDPQITVSPSPGYYPTIELFSACGTSSLCCVFADGTGQPVTLRPPSPLTPGQTYYIRVYHAFAGAPTTSGFDICVVNSPVVASCLVPPGGATAETEACGASVNNSGAGAQLITDGTSYVGSAWAECNVRDIDYYRIVTTQAGYLTVTVNAEFPSTIILFDQVSGAPGNQLANAVTPFECSGNVVIASPSAQPAGTYYVFVAPSTFRGYPCGGTRNDYVMTTVFTTTPPAPPANDNCVGAQELIVCGPGVAGRTLSATQQYPPIICDGDQSNFAKEVWYYFTANTTQHTVNVTGNFDGVLEVRENGCGFPTTACSDVVGNNESITLACVPGKKYFVRYYRYGVSDPPPGNFTISVTTTGGWSGLTSTDWGVASNWCSGLVPGVGTNVTIPDVTNDPVMLTAGNCNNLTLLPGGTITIAPNNLTVNGNVIGSNNTLTGSGDFIFGGPSSQAFAGSVNFQNVRISNTTLGGISVSNGANMNINGVLTLNANARLNNLGTGNVTVVSSPTTEGSIGVLGAGAQLNGNYTVQRYVPNGAPAWHFLGTSVSGNTYGDWTDDFQIRATPPVGGSNGVIPFDEPERATVFQYNEAAHNVKLDTVQKDGWRIPTSSNLAVGRGYRVFTSPTMFALNPSRVIDNRGPVTTGLGAGYNFPTLTRNEYTPCFPITPGFNPTECNASNRGWNLLANPFPSGINWDAPSGWTKPAQMNNVFYTWNSLGGGYQCYVGTGGNALGVNASTNTNPNIIPKGQGFFVYLTTAGSYNATLIATEAVKSNTSGQFVRTNTVASKLRVKIAKQNAANGYHFVSQLQFMDGATNGFDQHLDAHLLRGTYESCGFRVNGEDYIQNTLPTFTEYTVVPMSVWYVGQVGNFTLSFSDLETFPSDVHIYLKDKVLNALIDVRAVPSYTYAVNGTNNLNNRGRFDLIFSPTAITETKPVLNGNAAFTVYPNPSNGQKVMASMIGFENENTVEVSVTDMLGKVVYRSVVAVSAETTEHEIAVQLSSGVYNISCVGKNHKFTTKLVVD